MTILSNQFTNLKLISSGENIDLTLTQCAGLDYKALASSHLQLTLEYNILCAYLREQLENADVLNDELIAALMTARKITILLAYLYEHYLGVAREVYQHQKDETLFRELINPYLTEQLTNPWENPSPPDQFSQNIRTTHVLLNWMRLLIVRCKRLLGTLRPIAASIPFPEYTPAMDNLDRFSNPIFSYLSWAFFAPRLAVNVFLVLKHLIPHYGMSEQEKSLGWSLRAQSSFKRRWFELGNDSVWLASGALNCFLLLGSLLPVATYLTAALYVYDVILAALRAYIELRRLTQLKQGYLAQENVPPPALMKQLEQRYLYERRRLFINLGTAIGLSMAIGLTLPFLIMVPYLPLIAAALLVVLTIGSYIASKLNDRTKPSTQLGPSNRYGFFNTDQKATKPGKVKTKEEDVDVTASSEFPKGSSLAPT